MLKKVILITANLGSGGAERQLCGLAIKLKEKNYEVEVITYIKNQFYEPLLRDAGVEYEFHGELENKLLRIPRLVSILNKKRPDIVVSFLPEVNKPCCVARLFGSYKLIVGERNTNIFIYREDKIKFALYRLADMIVPNSHTQADFIKQNFSFLTKKTRTIINFVDTKRFLPNKSKECKDLFRVITVGRFTEQKNYLRYFDAIKIVKEMGLKIHFDCYGNSHNPRYYEQMLNKIKECQIEEYITLHDPTNYINQEYCKANALCLPSIYEGYPNVICEAMSAELPIICSNVVEMPRIVKEDENGCLFDPYNPTQIADAIFKMYNLTDDERGSMGRRNRSKVLMENSEEKFVERYITLFNEL